MKRYGGASPVADRVGRLARVPVLFVGSRVFRCFVCSYAQLVGDPTPARTLHDAGPRREDHVRAFGIRTSVHGKLCSVCVCALTFVQRFSNRRYKEGGPAAVANFEAGVQGFTTRAFRGCGVVTSDPFEVSDGELRSAFSALPSSANPTGVGLTASIPS
jgi:hypothetical protein